MKILGIDPGYDRLGIAIIEKGTKSKTSNKDIVLYSSCLQTSSKETIYERFAQIGAEVSRVIEKFQPDAMAIENLFITKNQKTAMRVSEARGIIIYEAIKRNILVHEYSPMQVKSAIGSDGTSDKGRIIKMIHLLVDMADTKARDDEYDAIAVALTHSAYSKNNSISKQK